MFYGFEKAVGSTPLILLSRFGRELGIKTRIAAKAEFMNPGGSVKDRAALYMINDAETRGVLRPGSAIVEATSGSMGISLAAIGAMRGYRVVITMPDTMSIERRRLNSAYGAQVVLTYGKVGMLGSIERAKEIAKIENAFMPLQFENPANPLAHYETTGPEIFRDCGARLDAFVAGIGSGGTITGAGRFLKEHLSDVRIIGVEPDESPFITTGKSGTHGIQGIGAGFIPHTLDTSVVDFVDTSSFEDSCRFCSLLARSEGMLCGISSGAALCAAVREAERINDENALVVVILPDTGERYLSQNLFGS